MCQVYCNVSFCCLIGVTSSSPLIHEGESSDGDDCSRSAIVSSTKRRCTNSSFTTELTHSRKRKRRRRRDELKKKSMSGSIHVCDEENGRTCVKENGDNAHITSSDFRTSMLVSNSLSDSPADSAAPGCGKFQLFVHVDEVGGSNVGPSRACSTKLKRHMLAGGHNERRKLKQVRKCAEAVREWLVKDCGQRTRKQQSPSENGSCEPSLLPNAMLSNSSLSSSSTVSNDVGKQGTQFDQLCRDLRVNGPCVDLATSSHIATESLLREKEVAMEHRLHRKRVARCRRGRLTSKVRVHVACNYHMMDVNGSLCYKCCTNIVHTCSHDYHWNGGS